jgi:hypothetical protein
VWTGDFYPRPESSLLLRVAEIMGDFRSDLKYAFRMLIASPAFTVTAIAALALGIGANTAIFTVVDAVLLKPLTYPDPGRIVRFMNTSPDGSGDSASPENFRAESR